ncbi:hypothetical protein ABW20_dc0104412 [Dactylellina cionopaga]|nr:hypothetical protein ABW20_dc0104412 [Dactylellina cionopaga]
MKISTLTLAAVISFQAVYATDCAHCIAPWQVELQKCQANVQATANHWAAKLTNCQVQIKQTTDHWAGMTISLSLSYHKLLFEYLC